MLESETNANDVEIHRTELRNDLASGRNSAGVFVWQRWLASHSADVHYQCLDSSADDNFPGKPWIKVYLG